MIKLFFFKKYAAGRNGKILCRTKGGKKKLLYRLIDFNLNFLFYNPFIFLKLVNDPNRNTKLILVLNILGFIFYILAAEKVKIPLICLTSIATNSNTGTANFISNIMEGSFIFNIPSLSYGNNIIARSSGMFGQLLKKKLFNGLNLIRLRNNNKVFIKNSQKVLLGIASNSYFHNLVKGKSGSNRNKGIRPIVRGVARNPIDHPNGGRTPGGKVYRSFSFKIARSSKKTRCKSLLNGIKL